jgi:Flp pilus assembly pilin Flp
MGQLARRLRSSETGSALIEYGLIIAVVAIGLVAMLTRFGNAFGDLTNRTAVTISHQSSRGYGGGVAAPPVGVTPVPVVPTQPDSSGGDSTAVGPASPTAAVTQD